MSEVAFFRTISCRDAKKNKDYLLGECSMICNGERKRILERDSFLFRSY